MAAVLDWFTRRVRERQNRRWAGDLVDRALELFSGNSYFEAFRASPHGIAFVGPNGAWLEFNDRLCEIVGRTRDELMHTTFQAMTTPDTLNADTHLLSECLQGVRDGYVMRKAYLAGRHHAWRKVGERIEIILKVDVVRERESGAVRHFISTIVDTEDLRRWADAVPHYSGAS